MRSSTRPASGCVRRACVDLHTGEVIKEAEDFGKTVILAARIAAQARGEQILVSTAVKDLTHAAGDLSSGQAFQFGGGRRVELKGLSGAYTLHPVISPAADGRRAS